MKLKKPKQSCKKSEVAKEATFQDSPFFYFFSLLARSYGPQGEKEIACNLYILATTGTVFLGVFSVKRIMPVHLAVRMKVVHVLEYCSLTQVYILGNDRLGRSVTEVITSHV